MFVVATMRCLAPQVSKDVTDFFQLFLWIRRAIVPYWVTVIKQGTDVRYEPRHEISNNVVCATSKASDHPAQTRSLIRAFASRLHILWRLRYWLNRLGVCKLKRRLHRLAWVYKCQNATLMEITCFGSIIYKPRHEISNNLTFWQV